MIAKDVSINTSLQNKIQIFHSRERDHWITASTVACDDGVIDVYDSSYSSLDEASEKMICKEFPFSGGEPVIRVVPSQKQKGTKKIMESLQLILPHQLPLDLIQLIKNLNKKALDFLY